MLRCGLRRPICSSSFVIGAVASTFLSISVIDMMPDAPPPSFRIRAWWCNRYLAVDRPAMPPPRMITRCCCCPDEGSPPSTPRSDDDVDDDDDDEGASEETTVAVPCILRDDRRIVALASIAQHSGACLRMMGCVASIIIILSRARQLVCFIRVFASRAVSHNDNM